MIRRVLRGGGFGLLTLAAGVGVIVGVERAGDAEAKTNARDRWSGAWSRGLLSMFGVEVVVHGHANAGGHGRVVVANHRSIIDIAVMLSLFGGAMVSRADVEGWPVMGRAAKGAGTIFVDRGSKKSGGQAVQAMVDRLAMRDTVCLFPEGTTFVDDEVRPFKPGAFVAAMRAHVPIVPVALVYPRDSGAAYGGESFGKHLARLADTPRTRVLVEIGAAMEPREGEGVDAFTERGRVEVARLVAVGRAKDAPTA
jgi:1-acyl-sn-glycerol-3-phosphate acyltransferase